MWVRLGVLSGLLIFSVVPMATELAAQNVAREAPQLSAACQLPGNVNSSDRPLPSVQRALKERRTIRILSIGTSSSALMRSTGAGYFSHIEKLLEKAVPGVDVQITDRSVTGELARDAADRIKNEVALLSPDLVLWQLGGNDALAHIPASEFEETAGETLEWLKSHDVDVVLIGMQYVSSLSKDAHYQAIRRVLQRVADQHKVLRISRYEATQLLAVAEAGSNGNPPNDFAVTELGYDCLSEFVVRSVTAGLILKAPATSPTGKVR